MGFMDNMKDELDGSYAGKRIKIKLGLLGEIEFERKEFLDLWAVQDYIAEIVNKVFSEKLVNHGDMAKEMPDYCEVSLREEVSILDQKRAELRATLPENHRQILAVLENLRTESVLCANTIRNKKTEMDAGNAGEYDSAFMVQPSDWLPDIIREHRVKTYPSFKFLIDVLSDDSTKERAETLWFKGLDALSNREKISSLPSAQVLK
jgi:hypothetical protein